MLKCTKKSSSVNTIRIQYRKTISTKAFELWNKYIDPNYAEKFCHFSGEVSPFSNIALTKFEPNSSIPKNAFIILVIFCKVK